MKMIVAFFILTTLIALFPALRMLDDILATGLVSAVIAVAIAAVAVTLNSSTLNRFSRLLKPAEAIVLFIPCLWMLLQVLPAPGRWLAHPIWASASSALDLPFFGAVSVDIGATLLSLAWYGAVLATACVTAAVTLDRQHAKTVLTLMTAVAALIAAELICFDLGFSGLIEFKHSGERAEAMNIAVIGFVLSCATAIRAYDQLDSKGTRRRNPANTMTVSLIPSILASLICLAAILISADLMVFFSTLFGAGIVFGIWAIRKWQLRLWGQVGAAAVAAVAVFGFFAIVPANKDADPTLAFSAQSSIGSLERMLSDVKWAGSGAGSLQALSPLYQGIDDPASQETATAAATIAIEMGRPFLWISVVVALIGAVLLFRRALSRGRDYVYPAAGAGCIIALLILLFASGGILGFTASLAMGVLGGLAVAQSQVGSKRDFDLSELYTALNATNDAPRTVMPPVSPAKTWMQFAMAFSVALTTQAAWILLAERYPAGQTRLPTDPKAASVMALEQDRIKRAASIAVVRGDLWTETAFTFAGQLWSDPAIQSDATDRSSGDVLKSLTQALRYSPHRGDVWLLFAALADRYKWARYQPGLLLKMSYYTAPNELTLLPLRLNVLLHASGAIGDAELQEMARRDISLILTRAPALKPALVDAYRSASPAGKAFAERVISEIDPGYLSIARAGFP
jgi:uncharacterized membrane protein